MRTKILITIIMLLSLFAAVSTHAAENGENVFIPVWTAPTSEPMEGLPLGLWDVVNLPDLDNDGRDEIFACADDPVAGAHLYVLQAKGNNEFEVIWQYFIQDCIYSFGLATGDMDADGVPELIAGVHADLGQQGLYFFEKDTTITDRYPFPDFPTSSYDVLDGLGGSIDQMLVDNLDPDPEMEIVLLETDDNWIYVLEETAGDIEFPLFNVEFVDSLTSANGSPWGVVSGDFDNNGKKDFAVGIYDNCGIAIYQNTGEEDSYELMFNYTLTPGLDGVSLRSLLAVDLNDDGFTELIYPTYNDSGAVFLIDNPGGLDLMTADNIHLIAEFPGSRLAGATWGDQDHTGSSSDFTDIYIAARDDQALYDLEFVGDDPTDPADYDVYTIYQNTNVRFQDVARSLGWSRDYDGDGRKDLVVVFANDSDPTHMVVLEHEPLPTSGLKAVWSDPPQTVDPTDPVHGNPRGFYGGVDVDQDGKKEFFCTEYPGTIHCYEAVGDNTLEWVWSDSTAHSVCSGRSQPRDLVVGDIDGNGRQEIIAVMGHGSDVHPDSAGVWFFEWDGVNDNGFGMGGGASHGGPTYILPQNQVHPDLIKSGVTENPFIGDCDGDGREELLWPNDGYGSDADAWVILSCVDGTLESGFPVFKREGYWKRADGWIGGSPKGATIADMDGDGHKEAIFIPWDMGRLFICESVEADSYQVVTVQTDTTWDDGVYYDNIGVYDIDGDGDDELMGAMYDTPGIVALMNAVGDVMNWDWMNPAELSYIRGTVGTAFGNALGDIDDDGNPDFFWTGYRRAKVGALTFMGGDLMDPANWEAREGFYDDSFVLRPTRDQYPDSTEYDRMLSNWEDNVHSLTDGSFGLEIMDDVDGDGAKELLVSTIQSPFSDTWLWVFEATSTGVKPEGWLVINPSDYKLHEAYPNPFNPTTTIEFELPLDKKVTLKIYNSVGQLVKTLVDNEFYKAGSHKVSWDATDMNGRTVASGLYVYSLEVGKHIRHTKRMTFIK